MNRTNSDTDVGQRLSDLLDHLGIASAHFAAGGDLEPLTKLVSIRENAIASLTTLLPWSADLELLSQRAGHIFAVFGRQRNAAMERARTTIVAASRASWLDLPLDYEAVEWGSLVTDHAGEILRGMDEVTTAAERDWLLPVVGLDGTRGEVSGISYKAAGNGAPLLLLPAGLSVSQWDAILPELQREFCVIQLGGAYLPPLSLLEDRAEFPGYRRMIHGMFDGLALAAGDSVLEVGTGAGTLARQLAVRTGGANPITAEDVNPFLLRQAEMLAEQRGLSDSITFVRGELDRLPFPSDTFGSCFAVTVLEECDADLMISELVRVTKPGGRIAVIVRAIDLPQYWHLDLPERVRRRADVPPAGPISERGCADGSLYGRFIRAGLANIRVAPTWAQYPAIPIVTDRVTAALDAPDRSVFIRRLSEARAKDRAWVSIPFHSAFGVNI